MNSYQERSPGQSRSNDKAAPRTRKPYTIQKKRESWSDDEHERFVKALEMYHRDWKRIEQYVVTKNVIQIRSHAQKYFLKMQKMGLGDKIPKARPKKKASRPYPRSSGSSHKRRRQSTDTNSSCDTAPTMTNQPNQVEVGSMGQNEAFRMRQLHGSAIAAGNFMEYDSAAAAPVALSGWAQHGNEGMAMNAHDVMPGYDMFGGGYAPISGSQYPTGHYHHPPMDNNTPHHLNESYGVPELNEYEVRSWSMQGGIPTAPVTDALHPIDAATDHLGYAEYPYPVFHQRQDTPEGKGTDKPRRGK